MLSSASDKAKHFLFAKNFSKKLNLEESAISLAAFPPQNNVKLHNFM